MTKTMREINRAVLRVERDLMESIKTRVLAPIERAMTTDFEDIFRTQGYQFLREFSLYQTEFKESFTPDDVDHIWGKVKFKTLAKMTTTLLKHTGAAMGTGYSTLSNAVGWGVDLRFNLKKPRSVDY